MRRLLVFLVACGSSTEPTPPPKVQAAIAMLWYWLSPVKRIQAAQELKRVRSVDTARARAARDRGRRERERERPGGQR